MRTTAAIKAELDAVVAEGEAAGARRDVAALDRAVDRASELQLELKASRQAAITTLGGIRTASDHGDLATALLDAGFDRKNHPHVMVEQHHALGIRLKAGSVNGGVDGTEVMDEFVAPNLGTDDRYVYPHLRTQAVNPDETGVHSYRQLSRSLASTTDMIRTIDATTAKPETNTVSEVVTEPLKQIATVSSGTPNVLLANPSFRSWVNTDLSTAYRLAVDAHVVTEIEAAGIGAGGGGLNIYEDILYAQEVVRAAGYNPNLAVLSPADALSLQLLQLTGATVYAFAQQAPTVVASPAVDDGLGFVADAAALGTLFLSPFSLQAFEEDAGSTNTSTVRAESNGLFLVQRPAAAASISAS